MLSEIYADVNHIVVESMNLSERLLLLNGNLMIDEESFYLWRKLVADGDKNIFDKRLTWETISLEIFKEKHLPLDYERYKNLFSFEWAKILKTFFYKLERSVPPCPNNFTQEIPFAEILYPFVSIVHETLVKHYVAANYINNDINQSIEKTLLRYLSYLSAEVLFIEFELFKKHAVSHHQEPGFQEFLEYLKRKGFRDVCKVYPVMARLLSVATTYWIKFFLNFFENFHDDKKKLQKVFKIDSVNLVDIKIASSDRHNYGSMVLILTLESDLKIVYKPRDIGVDNAFYNFLDICNRESDQFDFNIPTLLEGDSHGWIEFIEHNPCSNAEEIFSFYKRAGHLLCAAYTLCGMDFHAENLIAHGQYPIIIDLEMLLSSDSFQHEEETNIFTTALNTIITSVLGTGLLPQWHIGKDGKAFDTSGLGTIKSYKSGFEKWVWKNINTDDMFLEKGDEQINLHNLPFLNYPGDISVLNYVDQIISGFAEMYVFFIGQKDKLLSRKSLKRLFGHLKIRFANRKTRIYSRLLRKSLHPKYLQNGLSRSIQLDLLTKTFLFNKEKLNFWALIKYERQALERLDIPYFYSFSDELSIYADEDMVLSNYFSRTGFQELCRRAKNLNQSDLNIQTKFIRNSYSSLIAHESNDDLMIINNRDIEFTDSADKDFLIEYSQKLAERLLSDVIGDYKGLVWFALEYDISAKVYQYRPISPTLYSGNCGIAIFFSALAFITNNEKYATLSYRALQPVLEILSDPAIHRTIKRLGLGGFTGLGSVIYTFVRVSEFIQSDELLNHAMFFASQLTEELITSSNSFDIVSGIAGTIMGLLALYHKTSDTNVLRTASICGDYLLINRKIIENEYSCWKFGEKFLLGFSHGTSGIAYALLSLFDNTGNIEYLNIARQALAYESLFYNTTEKNWPDFRNSRGEYQFMTTWCHGAPGIALSRMHSISYLKEDFVSHDLVNALETTEAFPIQGVDHLCCGNLGRAEVLLLASEYLTDSFYYSAANKILARTLHNADKLGGFRLFGNMPRGYNDPSFMRGIAGIGYQLLRFAYPNKIPSVLILK